MSRRLIITKTLLQKPGGASENYQLAALFDERRMTEVTLQKQTAAPVLGNIYVARVQRVVENLSAAFVEIGEGQRCYLPLEDLQHPVFSKKLSKKPLVAGEELVVQVSREAVKTKDAVVTTNLSFSGEYLVLTSGNRRTGVSAKLNTDERKRLQALAAELLQADGLPVGIIMRTNAAAVSDACIRAEFNSLYADYASLIQAAPTRTAYTCLRRERPFYEKILMDADKSTLDEVLTDDQTVYRQLCAAAKIQPPDETFAKDKAGGPAFAVRLYEDDRLSLASLYNIPGQLADAQKPRVWLKSGANIIIEPTEALTVIDVNSGKNTAKKERNENHLRINLEAADEAARQLRLRNISGIIIIDFIDLYDTDAQEQLLAHLRALLKKDPVPTKLIDMTKLGLVEITRKKIRKSLAEQM